MGWKVISACGEGNQIGGRGEQEEGTSKGGREGECGCGAGVPWGQRLFKGGFKEGWCAGKGC